MNDATTEPNPSSSSCSNAERKRPEPTEQPSAKRTRTTPSTDNHDAEQVSRTDDDRRRDAESNPQQSDALLTDDDDSDDEQTNADDVVMEDRVRVRLPRPVLNPDLVQRRRRHQHEYQRMIIEMLIRSSALDPTFDRVTLPRENPMDKLEIVLHDGDGSLVEETCAVCLDPVGGTQTTHIVKPPACEHYFHLGCAEPWFQEHTDCPVCRTPVTVVRGTQPEHADNVMMQHQSDEDLPGYAGDGTLQLTFFMPSGIQGVDHPMPGHPYYGCSVTAFLPNNSEGKEIARLFGLAFVRRLLFRIGYNDASNQADQIIVNGIELKLRRIGGPANQGYPDPSYFCRLKIDLREMGVY